MKLHGVFVGINNYSDQKISNLAYAENDARSFYNLFQNTFSEDDVELHLLVNEQATKKRVLNLLAERLPNRVNSDDMVVVYYSGHGSPELNDSQSTIARYLVAYDTEYDSLFTTGINIEHDINLVTERLKCNKVVFLLDTCFSGRAGGKTFEGVFLKEYRRNFRSYNKAFSDLKLGEGRVILSACRDDEVAFEYPTLKHGIFTYSVLNILTNSNKDNGTIGIGTFYDLVLNEVRRKSKNMQNPVMYGSLSSGEFPLLIKKEGVLL